MVSDTSDYGLETVISHIFPDSSQKAITSVSSTLTTAERNYSQKEKEIFVIKKFHKILYRYHFNLVIDHKPLVSISGSKKSIPVYMLINYNDGPPYYWIIIL